MKDPYVSRNASPDLSVLGVFGNVFAAFTMIILSCIVMLILRDGFKVDRIHLDKNDLTGRISAVLDTHRWYLTQRFRLMSLPVIFD